MKCVEPISAKFLLKSSGGLLLLKVKSTNMTSGVRDGSFRQSQIWYHQISWMILAIFTIVIKYMENPAQAERKIPVVKYHHVLEK